MLQSLNKDLDSLREKVEQGKKLANVSDQMLIDYYGHLLLADSTPPNTLSFHLIDLYSRLKRLAQEQPREA